MSMELNPTMRRHLARVLFLLPIMVLLGCQEKSPVGPIDAQHEMVASILPQTIPAAWTEIPEAELEALIALYRGVTGPDLGSDGSRLGRRAGVASTSARGRLPDCVSRCDPCEAPVAGHVQSQAVYLALAINLEGQKELLGLWVGEAGGEGAKFWLSVLTELKNRGLQDILIAAVDGLKGFPDAIETVFPKTQVQLCIVHLIRGSLRYVSWKERKAVARDLKAIYQAPSLEAATDALETFSAEWDSRFPQISRMWRTHWTNLTPFFDYPPAIRKVIYTTNAVESVNAQLRKVTKHRGAVPRKRWTDGSARRVGDA